MKISLQQKAVNMQACELKEQGDEMMPVQRRELIFDQ
jgi:hypothetical protein